MVSKNKPNKKVKRISNLELQERLNSTRKRLAKSERKLKLLIDAAQSVENKVKIVEAKEKRLGFWLKVVFFMIILDAIFRKLQPL